MTTAPAPTTVLSPMVTPGQTITPPPSQTLSPLARGEPVQRLQAEGVLAQRQRPLVAEAAVAQPVEVLRPV